MSHYAALPVDAASVCNATYRQRYYADETIRRAREFETDPHREKRLAKSECVVCYGGSRIGGSMCCSRDCGGGCGEVIHSGNTNVDVLCLACAQRLRLCKRCGADIDLKQRRKPRDFTPPVKVADASRPSPSPTPSVS